MRAYDAAVRLFVTALVAAAVFTGCGDDDEPAETAPTAPPAAATEALWPPSGEGSGDPRATARSFVEEYIGIENPALSEFRETEPGVGEVTVHRRGEDGRALETEVAALALRRLDGETWSVISAHSPEVEVTQPSARDVITSPVRVAGRGRGFEGNVVIEVRDEYAVDPLAQRAVIAGSMGKLEPFSAKLPFDPGTDTGAIVAKTGSGIAAADGFAAFVVRFADG
ncbi:MAG TPA: Gmad2 immunoglobulin-like domain-containing protein [Thermoleophilaceae bacterium]|nr:Gmad2 immunoglobulin-like domain-containing protein [Thermoleophilaceae bacterium]